MVKTDVKRPTQRTCASCGAMSSQELCQACDLLASLQSGMARVSVNRQRKPKATSTGAGSSCANQKTNTASGPAPVTALA